MDERERANRSSRLILTQRLIPMRRRRLEPPAWRSERGHRQDDKGVVSSDEEKRRSSQRILKRHLQRVQRHHRPAVHSQDDVTLLQPRLSGGFVRVNGCNQQSCDGGLFKIMNGHRSIRCASMDPYSSTPLSERLRQ